MTIADALRAFEREWVSRQAVTPRLAYERSLRLLVFYLEQGGRSADEPLERLAKSDLEGFVRWHAAHGLADDVDGARKIGLHAARLGSFLAAHEGRVDLDVGRARLREVASTS